MKYHNVLLTDLSLPKASASHWRLKLAGNSACPKCNFETAGARALCNYTPWLWNLLPIETGRAAAVETFGLNLKRYTSLWMHLTVGNLLKYYFKTILVKKSDKTIKMKLWKGLHIVILQDCFKSLAIICLEMKGKEEVINTMNTEQNNQSGFWENSYCYLLS